MTYKTIEAADIEFAKQTGENLSLDLRRILNNERERLEKFEQYVDSWDEGLKTEDPRSFLQPYVIERAMEMVESIHHVHTGSTDHMNFRQFRTRALLALAGREH